MGHVIRVSVKQRSALTHNHCRPIPTSLATAEPIYSVCSPVKDTEDVDVSHVQCLIDALPTDVTDEQRGQASQFIRSYASLFSKSATDLGRNKLLPHRIDTGNHPPIRHALRRYVRTLLRLKEMSRKCFRQMSFDLLRHRGRATCCW